MNLIHLSDLHGNKEKYIKLCSFIRQNTPEAVFITGDILPNYYVTDPEEFLLSFLKPLLEELKEDLGIKYPAIYIITGNDDAAASCSFIEELDNCGLLKFINNKIFVEKEYSIVGYPYIPPSPFMLKDWEKYDVSRHVPRGTVSPEEGIRTVDIPANLIKHSTIKDDLNEIAVNLNEKKVICLFHSPPYDTLLDKIIGKDINGIEQIQSVGSIAIRRFIEKYQPYITLHGHLHESDEITGNWSDRIGETYCFNAAATGNELTLICINTSKPGDALRIMI